jgi:hypothetical protein
LDFIPPSKFVDFYSTLAILINFLNSKIDLKFQKIQFKIHFGSKEIPMEKVVPFFKIFTTIFYFKFFEPGKVLFGLDKFERV